jgi:hypothetical protein
LNISAALHDDRRRRLYLVANIWVDTRDRHKRRLPVVEPQHAEVAIVSPEMNFTLSLKYYYYFFYQ